MTKLIALMPVFYAGRTHRKGEVFDAQAEHAALLIRTKQVRRHEDVEPAPKARRQYRRRDMKAEA